MWQRYMKEHDKEESRFQLQINIRFSLFAYAEASQWTINMVRDDIAIWKAKVLFGI